MNSSDDCSKDYVQVFNGQSLNPEDSAYLSRDVSNGKICSSSEISNINYVFSVDKTVTIYYRTGDSSSGSGARRGLRVDFSGLGTLYNYGIIARV